MPNCKLATLAPYFSATTSPTHRALDDARATVDVLHGLFERLGPARHHLPGGARPASPGGSTPTGCASGTWPTPSRTGPGVYLFRGPRDEPLYVGTSNDLRSRVRSYFSSGEQRSRITEMVALAQRVETIPCAHDLEAAVRELRLIAEHKPRYNRRSRFPERALWVRLTEEPFPRLSVVRRVRPGAGVFLGPVPRPPRGRRRRRRRPRVPAAAPVHDPAVPRGCSARRARWPAWAGAARRAPARSRVRRVRRRSPPSSGAAVDGDPAALVAPLLDRVDRLAAEERYEDAAVLRDRVAVLVRAVRRRQRLESLAAVPELVLARPDGAGGWHLSVVRRGRLVAAGCAPQRHARSAARWPGCCAPPRPPTGPDGELAATVDETELILRWMEKPGTRLVELTGTLACPAPGTGAFSSFLARVEAGRGRPRPVRRRRGPSARAPGPNA